QNGGGGDGTGQTGSGAGAMTTVSGFGSNPGALTMYTYVPAGVGSNAPIVVAMHGCTQSAADYVNAGWNDLADEEKFYVVYPEQSSANNSEKCFNWFQDEDTTRDSGEALSIKQMVDWMKTKYSIDDSKVFVTGLSAGAAKAGDPSFTGTYPRLSVWHGQSDTTVNESNAADLVTEWAALTGISQTPDVTETVDGATHTEYEDASGRVTIERYSIPGMNHGTALDPKNGCGVAASYMLDEGICSTALAWSFFTGDPPPKMTHAGGSSSGGSGAVARLGVDPKSEK
ncbi:MAG: extracellular catalytic domain type 1 short-chain-length polyhydroxyalkanoate depolymerase, partial [Polyangiaceae bacterium]